jgi:hypothetical protein
VGMRLDSLGFNLSDPFDEMVLNVEQSLYVQ